MEDTTTVARKFAQIMQTTEQDAAFFLDASGSNIEVAINMLLNQRQSAGGGVMTSDMLQEPSPVVSFEGDVSGVGNTLSARAFAPGEPIQMVWRFRNVGQHAWPWLELVCADGDALGLDLHASRAAPLAPGQHVDMPVRLVAPPTCGSVGGAFRLRSEFHGYVTEPTWIMLEVAGAAAGTVGGEDMQMADDML